MSLVSEIEIYLLAERGWVPTPDICLRFSIPARLLRQDGPRPGLLDHFAVSSTKNGQNGYCHHKYLPTADWLPIKHRLRRHAIGELCRVRAWDRARHNCLTGKQPNQVERHTGQATLF